MGRICLITPFHVSFQPRVLREADSLHEAGHDVRVVCRQVDDNLVERDQRIMQSRSWRLHSLDLRRRGSNPSAWIVEKLRSRIAEQLFRVGLREINLAINSYVSGIGQLAAMAEKEPADWFIAHTQPALVAAEAAAKRWKALLGFDCEDLLAEADSRSSSAIRLIEKIYLPRCNYVSAASQCMASKLVEDYGIEAPLVLYNVFPLYLSKGLASPEKRPESLRLRLHWFGQTIGTGRGIEEAVEAMGLLGRSVELHLRGRLAEGYRSILDALAQKYDVTAQVVIHPRVDHEDLINTMGQFDVGLAMERPEDGNYSLTVTNKIFSYLLSGLAIAATDTPGQREIIGQIPSVGFLYPAGDPKALAEGLRRWLIDKDVLRAAQQAAWNAARQRFCWDIEKDKFLRIVQSVIS